MGGHPGQMEAGPKPAGQPARHQGALQPGPTVWSSQVDRGIYFAKYYGTEGDRGKGNFKSYCFRREKIAA